MKHSPNILLILTDQHHPDFLGYLGHPRLSTPNIDRLAARSRIFRNAYCPSPVCGPARASIFTGRYPPGHGMVCNWNPLKGDQTLLTDHLFQAGYYNALVGKLHLTPAGARHGFDWKRLCDGPNATYRSDELTYSDYFRYLERTAFADDPDRAWQAAGESEALPTSDPGFWEGWSWVDDEHHHTTWTGREAAGFLSDYKEAQPFFLNLGFFAPHHPYAACEPWDSLYDPDTIELPPSFSAVKESPFFDAALKPKQNTTTDWDEPTWRRIIAKYLGSISHLDREVGRILDALEAAGKADNTLIVFTADHGDNMGDYRMIGKGNHYESSARVPFLISGPGVKPGEDSRIINTIDLYGTLLDVAGCQRWQDSPENESRSFRSLLDGSSPADRANETFSIIGNQPEGFNAMLRRDEWKLLRHHSPKHPEPTYELLRTSDDVADLRDYATDAESATVFQTMKKDLDLWCERQSEKFPPPPSPDRYTGTRGNPGFKALRGC